MQSAPSPKTGQASGPHELRPAALPANVAQSRCVQLLWSATALSEFLTLHAEDCAGSCPFNLLARSQLYCRTSRDECSSNASCDDGRVCTYSDAGVRSLAVTPRPWPLESSAPHVSLPRARAFSASRACKPKRPASQACLEVTGDLPRCGSQCQRGQRTPECHAETPARLTMTALIWPMSASLP
jgi:hypothetical protein